jgi:metal-responsive CopG/Arc/MetJ family transcriptional regulator
MATAKVTITLEEETLERLDQLIKKHLFANRSRAIQQAIQEKLGRMERGRLARECAKLDPVFEKAMAEEGMSEELNHWPEY